jgi:hypothetical protein
MSSLWHQTGFKMALATVDDVDDFDFFRVRSCLDVNSDSVHVCAETSSIALGISRVRSDSGASRHYHRRLMALSYPKERRLDFFG